MTIENIKLQNELFQKSNLSETCDYNEEERLQIFTQGNVEQNCGGLSSLVAEVFLEGDVEVKEGEDKVENIPIIDKKKDINGSLC